MKPSLLHSSQRIKLKLFFVFLGEKKKKKKLREKIARSTRPSSSMDVLRLGFAIQTSCERKSGFSQYNTMDIMLGRREVLILDKLNISKFSFENIVHSLANFWFGIIWKHNII